MDYLLLQGLFGGDAPCWPAAHQTNIHTHTHTGMNGKVGEEEGRRRSRDVLDTVNLAVQHVHCAEREGSWQRQGAHAPEQSPVLCE